MEKTYNHTEYETGIYAMWEKAGAFSPPPTDEAKRKKLKPYCIIMPPPNANDPLHVGHAIFVTIEDILIRYHRMLGEAALWLPGTDHAGIETQYVFEKKLKKQGKSRFQYDRETLYQMIWDYVQENSETAIAQMKRLGASADWSRKRFTLEPKIIDLVLHTFETMHDNGLIYRGLRLINFCTKCGTGYSDLEMVHVTRKDPLYYLKYGPFTLATVRPETKFGDTAVAVHPKDTRYAKWVGKEIEVEGLIGTFKLKVIADEAVDPEFGTGVVKVTPAHDPNDFAMGERHNLPMKQVIGFDGKLTEVTGSYAGMKVNEARKKVVVDLEAKGLMEKIDENYEHTVATCYRCGTVIEPLPMAQFFMKVALLTKQALVALKEKKVTVYGAGHDKILKYWLTNLKDWNISRQIVWGIRMPIWYKIPSEPKSNYKKPNANQNLNTNNKLNNNIVVGFINKDKKFVSDKIGTLLTEYSFAEIEKGLQTLTAPAEATYVVSRKKPGDDYLQETDTFDTWFSSSQWPVVTLLTQGENQEKRNKKQENNSLLPYFSEDFDYYYPTSLMETGYDILPFWVMRMLMMGLYLTGEVPFADVYLHGLVRDEKGQKMSKSKGNVLNPLVLAEKYGADALRMALVMSTTAGHDSSTGENKVKGMRNFSNKIWNAARFIEINREKQNTKTQISNKTKPLPNKRYQKHLGEVVKDVSKLLHDLKIGLAAETLYNEFWHWWCDEVLESYKRQETSYTLINEGMKTWLTLLHPFVPMVTEAVWQELYSECGMLITQKWPEIR